MLLLVSTLFASLFFACASELLTELPPTGDTAGYYPVATDAGVPTVTTETDADTWSAPTAPTETDADTWSAPTAPTETDAGAQSTIPTPENGGEDAREPIDAGTALAPPTQPMTFQVNKRPELAQQALDRWNTAACLDLQVTKTGAHQILFTTEGFQTRMQLGWITGSWTAARILVRDESTNPGANWIKDRDRHAILMHELAHLLARTNRHLDNTVLTSGQTVDPRNSIITAELLTLVCAQQVCACFNPEQEPQVYMPPPPTS